MRWYVADFETTGKGYYEEHGETKVWLYAICDSEANMVDVGESMEGFMKMARSLVGSALYFHNLRFDGSFIMDWLLSHGWKYVDRVKDESKTFSCLIGDMGQWYSMTLGFGGHRQVKLYDSLKLLPFTVEQIARDFHLPILKESIDYEDYTVDERRIEYVSHDVRIIAMALKQIKAEGMEKMTTASCAFNCYKDMKGSRFMKHNFPDLGKDFLLEWRNAYRGGRCQVNPYYKDRVLKGVRRYDINSMYPWVMRTQPLPFGKPIKCSAPGRYRFELYKVNIEFRRKPGHMPCLLKKASLIAGFDSYYVETEDVETMWISNVDLELVMRHYDVTWLEYLEIWGVYTSTELFADYVDKWYGKKKLDKGAQRIVDKLMLNSLYGKFGSNAVGTHKVPKMVDGVLRFENSDEEDMKHYYLPLAIAVTSYAHKRLDDGIEAVGVENFVYCDTDSIHSMVDLPPEFVDQSALGMYKLEAIEEKSKYVRPKTYMYTSDGEISITCAGLPDRQKKSLVDMYGDALYDKFGEGFEVSGKLMPERVKGGTLLRETSYKIKSGRDTLLSL